MNFVVVVVVVAAAAAALYKLLQNGDGHIKKAITIEAIVHKTKKAVTCILI